MSRNQNEGVAGFASALPPGRMANSFMGGMQAGSKVEVPLDGGAMAAGHAVFGAVAS